MGPLGTRLSNDSIINSNVGKHVSQLETGLQVKKEFDGLVTYGYELLNLKRLFKFVLNRIFILTPTNDLNFGKLEHYLNAHVIN